MDYKTFILQMIDDLRKELGNDTQVDAREVLINNGNRYRGIEIDKRGVQLQPVIPGECLFAYFQNGASMKDCVYMALKIYEEYSWGNKEIVRASEMIGDWEQIKGKIYPSLMMAEKNRELLETVVYRRFLDLAICCDLRVCCKEEGIGKMRVNRNMLKIWKISEEELWRQAEENMAQDGYEVLEMEELLKDMPESDLEEPLDRLPMFILKNRIGMFGAAGILDKNVLSGLADKVEENLFILPSSVHEVILLPDNGSYEVDKLNQMISEINGSQVAPEEVLSEHAYYYDRKTQEISIAGQK